MSNELNNWHVASVVSPVDMTINGKYRYRGWTPNIEWCTQQFGKNQVIDGWCFEGEGIFRFQNERDMTLFLLRWS